MRLRPLHLALAFTLTLAAAAQNPDPPVTYPAQTTLTLDTAAPSTPFPHFWEQAFGSGRAILSLRQDYRDDLRIVKQATNFQAIRFHGILDDEVGLYTVDAKGQPVYNFSYVDQIYDGLLANGVRPFVEISFMPKDLASNPDAKHPFWYHPNNTPPKDYAQWDAMITAFAQHLVDRYGLDEVAQWRFEVWNEPNIDFWAGRPQQATYFQLYDHTAVAIKKVSSRLRVGGPATAQAAWVGDFLKHCHDNNIPVDFTSTHVYANDTAQDVFHTAESIPRNQMVCRSVRKVHDEIAASPLPTTPLIFSEYNATYANEPDITDTVFMGPWLATTISQCDGLTEAMYYWSFSDVFEEMGVVKTPFYGGYGLVAEDDIPKPALNAFTMLHHLGDRRLPLDSDSALATHRSDGAIVLALWNYAPPTARGGTYTPPPAHPGASRSFTLNLKGVSPTARVEVWRLDQDHGNVLKAFDAMGRPATPTRDQIQQLRIAGKAAAAEFMQLNDSSLTLSIPPQGLVLLTITVDHPK